jgi:hypothetical protein
MHSCGDSICIQFRIRAELLKMMGSACLMELAAVWKITAAEGRLGRKFVLMRIRGQ